MSSPVGQIVEQPSAQKNKDQSKSIISQSGVEFSIISPVKEKNINIAEIGQDEIQLKPTEMIQNNDFQREVEQMLIQKYNKKTNDNKQPVRAKNLTLNTADEEENWPLDSENKQLSYSKMVYERNLRHFRKPTSETNSDGKESQVTKAYTTYPVCGTSTGWFCCRRNLQADSDISEKLGLGVSLYFK